MIWMDPQGSEHRRCYYHALARDSGISKLEMVAWPILVQRWLGPDPCPEVAWPRSLSLAQILVRTEKNAITSCKIEKLL